MLSLGGERRPQNATPWLRSEGLLLLSLPWVVTPGRGSRGAHHGAHRGEQHPLQTAARGRWAAGITHERKWLLLSDLSKCLFFALASITSIWAEVSSDCNNIAPPNTWEELIWHFELCRACQSHREARFLLAHTGDCVVGNCYAQLRSYAAIKKVTACSPSPLSPKSNTAAAFLGYKLWANIFENLVLWLICKGHSA